MSLEQKISELTTEVAALVEQLRRSAKAEAPEAKASGATVEQVNAAAAAAKAATRLRAAKAEAKEAQAAELIDDEIPDKSAEPTDEEIKAAIDITGKALTTLAQKHGRGAAANFLKSFGDGFARAGLIPHEQQAAAAKAIKALTKQLDAEAADDTDPDLV